MSSPEGPIFTRTFDFLSWLLPITQNFPTSQRHIFTARLLNNAFELREKLEEANLRFGAERQAKLQEADEALAKVRVYLRLSAQWGWLSAGVLRQSGRVFLRLKLTWLKVGWVLLGPADWFKGVVGYAQEVDDDRLATELAGGFIVPVTLEGKLF